MTTPVKTLSPQEEPMPAALAAAAGTGQTSSSNPVLPLVFPKSLTPVPALSERLSELHKRVGEFGSFASQLSSFYSQLAKLHQKTVSSYGNIEAAPQASVLPLPSLLGICVATKEAQNNTANAATDFAALLANEVVPKLQRVERALSNDLNELKATAANYKHSNEVVSAQQNTQSLLKRYQVSLERAEEGLLPEGGDPYILRTLLAQRLKAQVSLENKLLSQFAASEEKQAVIEKNVERELEEVAKILLAGMQKVATPASGVATNIQFEIDQFSPLASYRQFVLNHPESFFGADVEARNLAAATFRGRDSPLARAVREGVLERRTKFLKTYAASRYVLTPLSLIELNNEGQPTLAINLLDAKLVTDHKHHDGTTKFVLEAQQVDSASGKRHTWVFRTDDAKGWTEDLATLLSQDNVTQRCLAIFGASAFNADVAADIGAGAAAGAVHSDTPAAMKESVQLVAAPASLVGTEASLVHDKAMAAYPVAGSNIFAGAASGNTRVGNGGVLASDIGAEGLVDGSAPPTAVPITPAPVSETAAVAAEPPLAVVEPVAVTKSVAVAETAPVVDSAPVAAVAPVAAAPVAVAAVAAAATETRERSGSASSSIDSDISQSRLVEGTVAWQAERDLQILRGSAEAEIQPPSNEPVHDTHGSVTIGDGGFELENIAAVRAKAAAASNDNAIDDADDASSVFSYDRKHRASTYTGEDYKPDIAPLDPKTERRLTQTSHKMEDPAAGTHGAARTETEINESTSEHISRRRSSVSLAGKRRNSRRATASYGSDLKPLSSASDVKKSLFFESDLPATTTGSAIE